MKSVSRGLRSSDVRQVVLYLALLHASGEYGAINEIAFLNPRIHETWTHSVGAFLNGCSGSASLDVLNEVAEFLIGSGGYW